ncbi:hypothetical protein P5673_014735 [Acropora cervicornis]|uniref:Uncharacterized protein n=1 Tax=Acropora cervicornis TaxID=6130 RepID=A0AAD9QIQ0_ACRCE|nr:hypothetical protein P5673_014735 [Acropora cervicornis]
MNCSSKKTRITLQI